ncbi:NAD(P)-binding protein [Aspergillus affinis]|uniref:NAD(P)-binding protein n=1 Tax=Aspergillus affinis TaxID=1070780 RepID=UPI0022FEE2C5|nr:NAD(P)-binding protein [Aspergillus affinis]KAI9039698.1 NAD(P)-binding protein [Aspergillus affinis]
MEFHINPDDLPSLAGTNSGIGLATTHFLLSRGANIIAGDIPASPPLSLPSPGPGSDSAITIPPPGTLFYLPTNVTEWTSIRALFEQGYQHFGHIDHVFANAGIRPQSNFLEETFDEDSLLAPPNLGTVDVNLVGVVFTLRLGVYYLKRPGRPHSQLASGVARSNGENDLESKMSPRSRDALPQGGKSIVLSASGASFRNFCAADYATAKHGVLGLMRGLVEDTISLGGVRVNAVAPSWTDTGMVPRAFLERVGARVQDAEVVARAVAGLFGDEPRHGELVYIWDGRFFEINSSEGGMLDAVQGMLPEMMSEGEAMRRLRVTSGAREVVG